ncbi:hypothetical protein Tco_1264429 [Tanacetum coccineum]
MVVREEKASGGRVSKDEQLDWATRGHFGFTKTPPEKFSGGGDVVAGGGRVAGGGGGLNGLSSVTGEISEDWEGLIAPLRDNCSGVGKRRRLVAPGVAASTGGTCWCVPVVLDVLNVVVSPECEACNRLLCAD